MTTYHKHRHSHGGDNPWICHTCGEAYPVPSLARDCENTHIEHQEDHQ